MSDEAVLLHLPRTRDKTAANGKRSHYQYCTYFDNRTWYNFVDSPGEPEAMKIKDRDFLRTSVAARESLVEQHPEILLSLAGYDAVLSMGILPIGFVYIEGQYVRMKEDSEVMSPENYVSGLGFQRLAQAIVELTDDTHIYDLNNMYMYRRKGEVCLACQRVDR